MPLTAQQQIVAQAPWNATPTDLIEVMNILGGDFQEVAVFGHLASPVMLDLQKAALTRNIPIPILFKKMLKNIDPTGSSGWTRKQVPPNPTGVVGE